MAATSITDLLVTCTVVPDRWEALGLISYYWKGQLEFLVDVNGSVKIKGVGFRIPVKVSDVLVKVNDPSTYGRQALMCLSSVEGFGPNSKSQAVIRGSGARTREVRYCRTGRN